MITTTVLLSELCLSERSLLPVEAATPIAGLEVLLFTTKGLGGPDEGLVDPPSPEVTTLRAVLVVLVACGHRFVLGLCSSVYQYHSSQLLVAIRGG
jgi:hypothetical protein